MLNFQWSMENKSNLIYFDRIATTGSSFAALEAGKIPAMIPTSRQTMIVAISIGIEIKIGKFNALDDMIVPMNTKNNPMAPPSNII